MMAFMDELDADPNNLDVDEYEDEARKTIKIRGSDTFQNPILKHWFEYVVYLYMICYKYEFN